MEARIPVAVVAIFIVTARASENGPIHWNYHTEGGVYEWCHLYDTCCGFHQSPINFDTTSVLTENFDSMTFHGYETKPNWINFKNNGHSINVDADCPDMKPYVSDGGFTDDYILAGFHFHWGSDPEQGSEHTVNGVHYPMEMHLVHYNAKYTALDQAFVNADGLAVLAVFYAVAEEDNPALDPIIEALNSLTYNGDEKKITKPNFTLMSLLPASPEYFYRYMGSLTTPPCSEVVTWTVFEVPQTMSLKQMDAFRSLMNCKQTDKFKNMTLSDNYRPIQKLKGRKIYRRHVSAGNSVSAQFPILFTAAASALGSRIF